MTGEEYNDIAWRCGVARRARDKAQLDNLRQGTAETRAAFEAAQPVARAAQDQWDAAQDARGVPREGYSLAWMSPAAKARYMARMADTDEP